MNVSFRIRETSHFAIWSNKAQHLKYIHYLGIILGTGVDLEVSPKHRLKQFNYSHLAH